MIRAYWGLGSSLYPRLRRGVQIPGWGWRPRTGGWASGGHRKTITQRWPKGLVAVPEGTLLACFLTPRQLRSLGAALTGPSAWPGWAPLPNDQRMLFQGDRPGTGTRGSAIWQHLQGERRPHPTGTQGLHPWPKAPGRAHTRVPSWGYALS